MNNRSADLTGAERVLLRRIQTLQDAIAMRADWATLEFLSDQVQSTAARITGTRGRVVDELREGKEQVT